MPTINATILDELIFDADILGRVVAPYPLGISEPFFTGSVAATPGGAYNLPVAIHGHRYNLEWAKYQRTTISPFREARDQGALPGENSLNPLAAWKRNRDDWSLGAGQTWADRTIDSANGKAQLEPRQFHNSKGIDPWTLGQFSLLPDTEVGIASAAESFKIVTVGEWMYYTADDSLQKTDNPDDAVPNVTAITGIGSPIVDIATDGERIYIATEAGMYVHVIGTSTAAVMAGAALTYTPTKLAWTNGWLFGAKNNEVSEIRSDGTVNSVFTHLNDSFSFAAIVGTPSYTYFGGQATDVNEIYRVGVKNDGTLMAGIFSGSLPKGEFIRAMEFYSAFILVGTTKGIHVAVVAGDGSLSMSPVIETTTDVACMAAESRYVWFGWSEYDVTSTGLGRFDLSAFTDIDNIIASWASDLMYTGDGAVTSVARYKGHTYFAVEEVGIVRETEAYVASGSLEMGRFRWGTFEPKVWLGLEVASDPLSSPTDGRIVMSILDDAGITTAIGARGPNAGTTGVGLIYGVGTVSRARDWFEPTVTLEHAGDDGEFSPIVRRVTLRALPVPKTVEQFTLPLLVAEKVNDQTGEGGDVGYAPNSEYSFLRGLVAQGTPVTFQIAGEQHLVTVREVGWDAVYGMTTNRDGVNGLLVVTLISAEI